MLKGGVIAWVMSTLISAVLVFMAGVIAAVDGGAMSLDPTDTAIVIDRAMSALGASHEEQLSWRSLSILGLAFCWIFREQARRIFNLVIDVFEDGVHLLFKDDDKPPEPTDDERRQANLQRFQRGEPPP